VSYREYAFGIFGGELPNSGLSIDDEIQLFIEGVVMCLCRGSKIRIAEEIEFIALSNAGVNE